MKTLAVKQEIAQLLSTLIYVIHVIHFENLNKYIFIFFFLFIDGVHGGWEAHIWSSPSEKITRDKILVPVCRYEWGDVDIVQFAYKELHILFTWNLLFYFFFFLNPGIVSVGLAAAYYSSGKYYNI